MAGSQSIRRIALGLAVAAIVTPATAQARPLDVNGGDSSAIHQLTVGVVGSEDLAFSRQTAGSPTAVSAHRGDSYDAGVGTLGGLVLILAAAATAVGVHHSRKAKLSPRNSQLGSAAREAGQGRPASFLESPS
jgi:hypothetical protein